MARGSAGWVLVIVSLLSIIVGAMMFTVMDPVMQDLFASAAWGSSTAFGSDLLGWLVSFWKFMPVIVLLSIGMGVWVKTRRPS